MAPTISVLTYLDVKINIGRGLRTSVFRKVHDFNFPVILLTFLEGLYKRYYDTIGYGLLCFRMQVKCLDICEFVLT